MILGARTGAWAKSGGAPLPYDHAVEYLETDGNQYIRPFGMDTITMGQTYRVMFDFQFLKAASSKYYGIGETGAVAQCFIVLNSANGIYACVASGISGGRMPNQLGTHLDRHVFEAVSVNGALTYDFDGERIFTGLTDSFNLNRFYLLALGETNFERLYSGNMRMFSAAFSASDGKQFDMIPVRKDGVGYMYDLVSGQLFGNQGTGAFLIGPDK